MSDSRILKIAVPLLVLAILMFKMMSLSFGLGFHSLDTRFYYSAAEATRYFSELSPAQHDGYVLHEIYDLVFMIAYSALFFFLLEEAYPKRPSVKWVGLVPYVFDFAETSGILICLKFGVKPFIASALGVMTALKWISVLAILLILLGRTLSVARSKPSDRSRG